jgi:uncharacterized protein YerC
MDKNERKTLGEYIKSHPEQTYHEIARITGLGYSTIARVGQEFQVNRTGGRHTPLVFKTEEK